MDWRQTLQQFLATAPPSSAPTSGPATLSEALDSEPAVKASRTIPTFYTPKTDPTPAQKVLRRASRVQLTQRKNQEILSNTDLEWISAVLAEHSEKIDDGIELLSYEGFQRVVAQLPKKSQAYLKASVFLRLAHDDRGRINANTLFNYILRRASLLQERVCVSVYDSEGRGYLLESDMDRYISDLIPTFPQLESIDKDFLPFYLCSAVRKFFFFLDPLRRGRVTISDLLLSPILSEFFELQQGDLPQNLLLSNWFSLHSAMKTYSQYVELDTDRNGMLGYTELLKFANGRYTDAFLRRVFQECQTFSGEMDYKNYLDFVLAMSDMNHPQSLAYIFRLLDIQHQGYLDEFTIVYFLKAIQPRALMPVNYADFLNELYDMAGDVQHERITLQNLIQSGVGGSIVSLLIDVHAFTQNQYKE